MIILGIHLSARHAAAHPPAAIEVDTGSSAALLVQHEIAAVCTAMKDGVHESRSLLPLGAIGRCLALPAVHGCGIDVIAFSATEEDIEHAFRQWTDVDGNRSRQSAREHIAHVFQAEFGIDVDGRLVFCSPLSVHALAVWHRMGKRDILCVAQGGPGQGEAIVRCRASRLDTVWASTSGASMSDVLAIAGDILKTAGHAMPSRLTLDRDMSGSASAKAFKRAYTLSPGGRFEVAEKAQFIYALRKELFAGASGDTSFAAGVVSAALAATSDILRHALACSVDSTRDGSICLSGGMFADPVFAVCLAQAFPDLDISAPGCVDSLALAAAAAHLARRSIDDGALVVGMAPASSAAHRAEARTEDALARWAGCIRQARPADLAQCCAEHIAAGRTVLWGGARDADIGASPAPRSVLFGIGQIDAWMDRVSSGGFQLVASFALMRGHIDLSHRYTANNLRRLHASAVRTATMDATLRHAVEQSSSIEILAGDDTSALADIARSVGRMACVPALCSAAFDGPDDIAALLLGMVDVLLIDGWEIRADQDDVQAGLARKLLLTPAPGAALATFATTGPARHHEISRPAQGEPACVIMAMSPEFFHLLGRDPAAASDAYAEELAALWLDKRAEVCEAWLRGLVRLQPCAPHGQPAPAPAASNAYGG